MNFINKLKNNESAVIKRQVYGLLFILFSSSLIGISVAQDIQLSEPTSVSSMDNSGHTSK
jgi:hypothetical protein